MSGLDLGCVECRIWWRSSVRSRCALSASPCRALLCARRPEGPVPRGLSAAGRAAGPCACGIELRPAMTDGLATRRRASHCARGPLEGPLVCYCSPILSGLAVLRPAGSARCALSSRAHDRLACPAAAGDRDVVQVPCQLGSPRRGARNLLRLLAFPLGGRARFPVK